ncbi:MAG: hypothetical protein AAGJ79_11585, partial [Verrucomicrobiota bacterium]
MKNSKLFAVALGLILHSCKGRSQVQQMNVIEFEPHLEKPYEATELYGVGFSGYADASEQSNVKLLGWKQGASTRSGARGSAENIDHLTRRRGTLVAVKVDWRG